MKRSFALLAAIALASSFGNLQVQAADKTVAQPTLKPEISITYTAFEGNPVQLVVDQKDQTVRLQVELTNSGTMTTAATKSVGTFLEQEATRFGMSETPIPIGESGLSFKLDGRYQVAKALSTSATATRKGYLQTLLGTNPRVIAGVIQARGTATRAAASTP